MHIFGTLSKRLSKSLFYVFCSKQKESIMQTKYASSIWYSMLFLCLFSPTAFATPEEDVNKAVKLLDSEDIKEASILLHSAAEQNYTPAQVLLGEFMYGSEDYDEALGWFLTAALQGNAAGQFHLGEMYAFGFGIDKSPEKALFWIKKSADQNYLPAVKLLAENFKITEANEAKKPSNRFGITQDADQAKYWGDKLPALEKIEAKRLKDLGEANDKLATESAEKVKQSQSKLLCGLKC
jgi:hypothetical protein